MDLVAKTKQLCREYGIVPARSKGQNFLIREKVYERIVELGTIAPTDIVVEVGPGLGFLTEKLAQKAKRVIAVELDDTLARALGERLTAAGIENVEVINEDVLKVTSDKLQVTRERGYKVIANLPYNITSRVIRKFLSEMDVKPSLMVVMVQREVAERLAASPPAMSLLGVSAQLYAEVRRAFTVSPGAFWPPPKIDSAVVILTPRLPLLNTGEGEEVERVVKLAKIGFAQKRKTLANNLKEGLAASRQIVEESLVAAGLDIRVRAQELTLADWRRLFVVLHGRNMV